MPASPGQKWFLQGSAPTRNTVRIHPMEVALHLVMAALCVFLLGKQYPHVYASGANPEFGLQSRMELENLVLIPRLLDGHWGQAPTVGVESGLTSYGIAGLLPFAVGYRLFGIPGILGADALVTALNYLLWYLILRQFNNRILLSSLLSCLLVGGGWKWFAEQSPAWTQSVYAALRPASPALLLLPAAIATGLTAWNQWRRTKETASAPVMRWVIPLTALGLLASIHHLQNGEFWYSRHLPRPYATSLFTSLWFLSCLNMAAGRHPAWILSAWAAAAMTMQSDVYAFPAYGALFLLLLVTLRPVRWKFHALGFGFFALLSLPFLLQRKLENPQVPLRLGIDVLRGPWTTYFPDSSFLLPLAFAGLVTTLMLFGFRGTPGRLSFTQTPAPLRSALPLALFTLIAWCLTPLAIRLFLGKAPQMWHYAWLLPAAFSWFGFLAFSHIVSRFPRAAGMAVNGALACCVGALVFAPASALRKGDSSRPSQKSSLEEVSEALHSAGFGQKNQLASLDPGASAWWSAFRGEVVSPFCVLSPLSDEEQNRRVAWFLNQTRLPESSVARYLNAPSSRRVYFFLGCYQRAGLQAPPDSDPQEYPPGGLALSPIEIHHITNLMREKPEYPADVLILSRDDEAFGLSPDPAAWKLVAKTSGHTLYAAIESKGNPAPPPSVPVPNP